VEAATGLEGITAVAAQAPVLCIVDERLSDRSGARWAEDLRTTARHIPILLLSSQGGPNSALPHAVRVVPKPLVADTFHAEVDRLLAEGTPVMTVHDEIEEGLRRLRADFIATLPARLKTVRESIEQALGGGGPPAAAVARNIVHQLRGTGSSFGLPELTDAAGRAEQKLREYEAHPSAPIWPELERALGEMDALCRREGVR